MSGRHRIELGLTPDSRWTDDTGALAEAAHAAGFRHWGCSPMGRPRERSRLSASGLRCQRKLLALVIRDDPGSTVGEAERLAEAAAAVGAEWVLQSRTPLDDDVARFVRRCAEVFWSPRARRWPSDLPPSPISTLRAGLEMVALAGGHRCALVIDAFHFCAGASTGRTSRGAARADRLRPVHDGRSSRDPNAPPARTLWRRALPGEGDLPDGAVRRRPCWIGGGPGVGER